MNTYDFQNQVEDLEEFYNYFLLSTGEGRKKIWQIIQIIQVFFIIGILFIWLIGRNFLFALTSLGIIEFFFFIRIGIHPITTLAKWQTKVWIKPLYGKEMEAFLLPKQLRITKDSFSIFSISEKHSFAWNRVSKIEKTKQLFFVFCGIRTVYIIPRRSFTSQAEFENIYASIKVLLIADSNKFTNPTIVKLSY